MSFAYWAGKHPQCASVYKCSVKDSAMAGQDQRDQVLVRLAAYTSPISDQNISLLRYMSRYTQSQDEMHDSLWFLWRACLAWGPVLLARAIPPVLVRASAITVAVPSSVTAHHWGQVSRSNLTFFP